MDEDRFFLDPCPDSVWMQLPGGPVALDDTVGESWQYTGSARLDGNLRHEFRHRGHPDYGNARVYAHVNDDDAGPRLSRLVADGRELPLPVMPGRGAAISERR
jgi:hypothetical protein